MFKSSFRLFTLMMFCLVCALLPSHANAQTHISAEEIAEKADSTRMFRKQYSGRKTWEKLVSFPGTLISLPILLVSETAEVFVGYIYDEKLIPRTREFLTSADGRRALTPKHSNRTGFGAKLYQNHILSNDDQLSITATGDFKRRQRYRIEWKRIQLFDSPLSLNLRARYRFLSGETFFGIGPDTRKSDAREFDHEYTTGEIGLAYDLSSRLVLRTQLRFDHNNIFSNNEEAPPIAAAYDRNTLPGLQTRVRIIQYQTALDWDSRDKPGNPTSGQEVTLSGTLFSDIDNGPFNFRRAALDVSQYLHLGYQRVIRLRIAGEITEGEDDSDKIPFYYLSELGRQESIRGFVRGRFRDLDRFIASLEYRIPLWHSMDFFGFIDAGQVMGNIFEELAADQLQFGYGGGIHLFSDKEVIATAQIAFSKERIRLYLNIY